MRLRSERERGFSLIELMMAMVVTLMVTGAIYGLLSGGEGAFRREPALTDRQQNIRLAMDLIMRDVAAAGTGMPAFIQSFTPDLDGASLTACTNNAGAPVPCPDAASGGQADELEIITNTDGLALERACGYDVGNVSASHVRLVAGHTSIVGGDVVMILLRNGRWTLRTITGDPDHSNNGSAGSCTGGDHADVGFNSGNNSSDPTGYNQSGGVCAGTAVPAGTQGQAACTDCLGGQRNNTEPAPGNACCSANGDCDVVGLLQGEIVRYRIRTGTDDGVPNLERFSSGRVSSFDAAGNRQFQVVARGIDDLQVVYTNANSVQTDDAPQVDQGQLNYGSLIQSATVTLSARSEVQNVAGARTPATGPAALRGTLTSSATPRAVLDVLGTQVAGVSPPARKPGWIGPSPWY